MTPMSTKQGLVAVIGGCNLDIGGVSAGPLVPGDSNPGAVRSAPGGVGRNMANVLALLGVPVELVTAIGGDGAGRQLTESCARQGIGLSWALLEQDCPTSIYLYLAEPGGEMVAAISDMEIQRLLTPAYLEKIGPQLAKAEIWLCDTNPPAETLARLAGLAAGAGRPLFVDGVSTVKAAKLLPILGQLHTLKVNKLEAEELLGRSFPDEEGEEACLWFLERGLRQIVISLGERGACYASRGGGPAEKPLHGRLPCFPGFHMANTTGCGDAFTAGLVWAYREGWDLETATRAGLALGAVTGVSPGAVNPAVRESLIRKMLGQERPELRVE